METIGIHRFHISLKWWKLKPSKCSIHWNSGHNLSLIHTIEKCHNSTKGPHGTFSSGNTAPVTSFATQVSALLLLRFFSCSKAASLRCLTKGLFSYYSTNFYKEKERRVYHELENRAESLSKNSILLKKWWTVDITKFGGCLKSLENTYLEIDMGMEL